MKCPQNFWYILVSCLLCLVSASAMAQGDFFGGLQLNNDFYVRDPKINATGTPHYDNLKSGTDAWFDLNYVNNKYQLETGVRLDLFNNSNLHNPGTPYTGVGLGKFYIRKKIFDFNITAGYIYDQFGSGIIFRAYENRSLGIDNAILGVHVEYTPIKDLRIKAFTGVEKNRLALYKPIIKGINVEYSYAIKKDKATFTSGIGALNRTLDQSSVDQIVSAIETYTPSERFVPKYNTFAFTAYNTLNFWKFTWYAEGAYKTHEAINDDSNHLIDKAGNVEYSTLTFSTKGVGITGLFKRTQNFVLRTSPGEILLNGLMNFIPPVTQQNSLRLPARYNAASQELEELAYALDATFTPTTAISFQINGSEVRKFDHELLFREVMLQFDWRVNKKIRLLGGFQFINYNQLFYERNAYTPDNRLVTSYTPFAEVIWKVNRKHSLRWEVQHMYTKEDFGSWIYGLMEYSIAPWLSLAVSDMYNYKPNEGRTTIANHYYSVFSAFTWKSNRFTLAYVRQVAGVVCTGGVCRLEPAFSGVRMTLNTTF